MHVLYLNTIINTFRHNEILTLYVYTNETKNSI